MTCIFKKVLNNDKIPNGRGHVYIAGYLVLVVTSIRKRGVCSRTGNKPQKYMYTDAHLIKVWKIDPAKRPYIIFGFKDKNLII